jgi:ketosteroid isomerase-like protein
MLASETSTPVKRRFFLLLSLLVGLLVQLLSAAGLTGVAPTAEINRVLKAQAQAWNRGDIDGYMQGYARAPSTQFVSGDTLTRGWETVRNRYKAKYDSREKMGTLAFADVKVTELAPDSAMAVGRWRLHRKNDRRHGRFTLLFRKLPEGWRIVHDHTSSAGS